MRMNEKQKVVDKLVGKTIITEFELVEDTENIDRVRDEYESVKIWEGTILYDSNPYKFRFTNFSCTDNGSQTAEILSKKPEGMKEYKWEMIKEEMIEFIEDEYRANVNEWNDS